MAFIPGNNPSQPQYAPSLKNRNEDEISAVAGDSNEEKYSHSVSPAPRRDSQSSMALQLYEKCVLDSDVHIVEISNRPTFSNSRATKYHLDKLVQADKDDITPVVMDILFMHALVGSENYHNPELNLSFHRLFEEKNGDAGLASLGKSIAEGVKTGRQWRAVLDTDSHRMAMSVHHDESNPRNLSVLIIDAANTRATGEEGVEIAKEQFDTLAEDVNTYLDVSGNQAVRIAVNIVSTKTHGTKEGCDIFALADAENMLNNPSVTAIHEEGLAELRKNLGVPAGRLIDAKRLSSVFYRLATSPEILSSYFEAHPELADVEKILKAQQAEHIVSRGGHRHPYSNMYEKVRIFLFTRLLSYQEKSEEKKRAPKPSAETLASPGFS